MRTREEEAAIAAPNRPGDAFEEECAFWDAVERDFDRYCAMSEAEAEAAFKRDLASRPGLLVNRLTKPHYDSMADMEEWQRDYDRGFKP